MYSPIFLQIRPIIMRELFVFGKEYNCETNVDKLHNVIMVRRYPAVTFFKTYLEMNGLVLILVVRSMLNT